MSSRTSLILDDESRRAARQLSHRYGCSVSEAIRRAVLRQRDDVFGKTVRDRARRRKIMTRLFVLFKDCDPEEEVGRLKREDDGF